MPPRFGGYGLGFDTWFDVTREISKADASHGWCASLIIHHAHCIAQFPEEAQEAVWADGPDVAIAASFLPGTTVVPADGGYRLSGQSAFASGVGHSTWVFVNGMIESGWRAGASLFSYSARPNTRSKTLGSRPACVGPAATPSSPIMFSCRRAGPLGCRKCARAKGPAARCTRAASIARHSSPTPR